MDEQRNDCEEVRRFLHEHVPGVASGTIAIKGIARSRGKRTIIAVHSKDESVDPVGSCVGQRGILAKTLVKHLSGEKVDIVRWSDSLRSFLVNSLAPAKIDEISINEKARHALIFTDFDSKQLILGVDGLRLKLVSQLVGWELQLETG